MVQMNVTTIKAVKYWCENECVNKESPPQKKDVPPVGVWKGGQDGPRPPAPVWTGRIEWPPPGLPSQIGRVSSTGPGLNKRNNHTIQSRHHVQSAPGMVTEIDSIEMLNNNEVGCFNSRVHSIRKSVSIWLPVVWVHNYTQTGGVFKLTTQQSTEQLPKCNFNFKSWNMNKKKPNQQ